MVGLFFVAVYVAIGKSACVLTTFKGSNLRYFEAFKRNVSQMQVWVPENNMVAINEVRSSNLFDYTFWDAYFEEQDL